MSSNRGSNLHRGRVTAPAPAVAMPPPERYVVRIYRRDARRPTRVAGTVEWVGHRAEVAFRNLRELQRLLTGTALSKS